MDLLIALTVALGGSAAAADTTADPLRSPACRAALEDLQAREAALRASTATTARSAAAPASAARPRPGTVEARVGSASIDPGLQRLRDAAARACLASRLDAPAAPAPARLAQPPVVVPSSAGAPRSPTLPTVPFPLESPRPAVPQTPAPAVVTTCDAAGCWTSDGRRLERVGPNMFVGPRGVCSAQGVLLQCP